MCLLIFFVEVYTCVCLLIFFFMYVHVCVHIYIFLNAYLVPPKRILSNSSIQ